MTAVTNGLLSPLELKSPQFPFPGTFQQVIGNTGRLVVVCLSKADWTCLSVWAGFAASLSDTTLIGGLVRRYPCKFSRSCLKHRMKEAVKQKSTFPVALLIEDQLFDSMNDWFLGP